MDSIEITRLLDGQGRLPALPKRPAMRLVALRWLVARFSQGIIYSEGEVNALLVDRSATGDYALLRRELCESGLLSRTRTGSRYWRSDFLRGEANCGDVLLRDLRADDVAALLAIHESLPEYDDISGQAFTEQDAQALIERTDLPPGGSSEFFGAKMILLRYQLNIADFSLVSRGKTGLDGRVSDCSTETLSSFAQCLSGGAITVDGQPAGYLMTYSGYPHADTLWLGSLFLRKEHQHRGIGQAVIRQVTEQASAVGFRRIALGVYAGNTPGLQFWVRQGFCHIDRVKVDEKKKTILALAREV